MDTMYWVQAWERHDGGLIAGDDYQFTDKEEATAFAKELSATVVGCTVYEFKRKRRG